LDIRGLRTKSGFSLAPGGGLTAFFFGFISLATGTNSVTGDTFPLKIHRFRENDQHLELGIGVRMMS
jgi:hypothetical protein